MSEIEEAKSQLENLLAILRQNGVRKVKQTNRTIVDYANKLKGCEDSAPSDVCDSVDLQPGNAWAAIAKVLIAKYPRKPFTQERGI